MVTTWITLVALATAATPQETVGSAAVAPAESPPPVVAQGENGSTADDAAEAGSASKELRKRTGRELLAAVRETLARLARPEDDQLEASVEELLFVYEELRNDDAMAISLRESYTAKVKCRLQQLSSQLQKRIARNKRLAKSNPPEQIRDPGEAGYLAQRAGGAGRPVPPRAGNRPSGSRGGMQPSDDYGQHLVDLIQKTIAPSSWDVSGGLGTIYYWRPGRALVVRQTDEVHDNMGDLLGQLRRAGN
ncbi:MAG: hypothetical protein GXX96_12065 [Planctomycetaceae bacterium]|nr:hypothetical protein [Planctomycetaceae bacterium]